MTDTWTILNAANPDAVIVRCTFDAGSVNKRIYDQPLCGLPLDDVEALTTKLDDYVREYRKGLDAQAAIPPAIADIINEPQEVV